MSCTKACTPCHTAAELNCPAETRLIGVEPTWDAARFNLSINEFNMLAVILVWAATVGTVVPPQPNLKLSFCVVFTGRLAPLYMSANILLTSATREL